MRNTPWQCLVASAFVWLASFGGLRADPAPPPPPPATLPSAPTPAPVRTVTRERSIYVPFEQLEKVFEKQDRGVFLPYREFLEMWNKLNLPENLQPTAPPKEGVLSSATYTGKVEGDVATFQAHLNFEALQEGWSKLALGAEGLAMTEAKSKAILSAGENGYEILFPEKGNYTLDATVFGQVTHEAGHGRLELSLPATAVSQFELSIPEKGLEFTIEPAAAYSAAEQPDGSTKLLVYFGSKEKVAIIWTHRANETALKPLLFAEMTATVHFSPGAVKTEAQLVYQIRRAPVESFEIEVPADEQVLSVEGENIKDWAIDAAAKAPAPQKVRVTLHKPAHDVYTLALKLERALGALPQPVAIPVVQALQVERQSGTVALYSDPDLTTEVSDLQELTQQAAPPAKPGGERIAGVYRYLHLPFAGKVTVSEAKPLVEVTSETLVVVEPERAEVTAKFEGTIKRAGIFGLEVDLPAGFTHFEAKGQGIESSEAQGTVMHVKFSQRATGAFRFTITGDAIRAKPEAPLTVPVFFPHADRHEARVGVALHVSLKANTTDRGDLREEDVRGLIDLPVPKPETTPLTLGFRYRGAAKPAQVQFEPRKPRITADVQTLFEVREALLRHTWTLTYNVEYAGVDEFSFSVPAEIADDLQIEGADIKERTRTPAKGQPGDKVTWRVALQAKVLGNYVLLVTHETPRTQPKQGEISHVEMRELETRNVSRETGQVAVLKDNNIEIVKDVPHALELIDPKELGPNLHADGIVLAYKYATHPMGLQLDVAKNLFLEVPAAIVTYAVLGSVISEDEAETTEAIYWVKNNGQQFFAVQLPGKDASAARLLSDAFVDGQPQQPSRRPEKNELLIRLPSYVEGSRAFAVRFVYERPSPHPGSRLGMRGTLQLEPPQVSEVQTLQSRWTIFLPAEHRYLRFDGAMREPVGERGWDMFRLGLDFFVPQFGPNQPGPELAEHAEPPPLPEAKATGFDTQLQQEGVPTTLRRLGPPSAVTIAYRSKAYMATLEALGFLLALGCGLYITGRPRRERFAYFAVVGFGALIVAGAKDPRSAGVWQAIWLGAFAALGIWLALGLVRWVVAWPGRINAWREKRRHVAPVARVVHAGPPSPPPPPPAHPPQPPVPPTTPPPAA